MQVATEGVGFGVMEDYALSSSFRVIEQRLEDIGCGGCDDVAVDREFDWALRIVGTDGESVREVRSATLGQ